MTKTKLAERTCASCPLRRSRGVLRQVPTEYYPNKNGEIDIFFIYDAPGAEENSSGIPAVGKYGYVLRRFVKLNLSDLGVAYGTLVRCRPTVDNDIHKSRRPTKEEIKICKSNILADIKKLKPKYIVLLGDLAAKSLANTKEGLSINAGDDISVLRGLDYTVLGIPATITYHFSFVYRHPRLATIWRDDILRAAFRGAKKLPDFSKKGKPAIIIDTVEKAKKLVHKMIHGLSKNNIVAFDYETEGLKRFNNPIVCVGFSWKSDLSYVIPIDHYETPWSYKEREEIIKLLKYFFSRKNVSFGALVAHNLEFERIVTKNQIGAWISMVCEDTMLRAHALNEDRKDTTDSAYSLKRLAKEFLGYYGYDELESTLEARSGGQLYKLHLNEIAEYNAIDCYVTYRLYMFQRLYARLTGYKYLEQVGRKLHGPITGVIAALEINGIRVGLDQIRLLMKDDSPVQQRVKEIEEEFYSLPTVKKTNEILLKKKGIPVNGLFGGTPPRVVDINKPDSKKTLFFKVLDLAPVNVSRKTGEPSVDKSFKKRYSNIPEVKLLDEWSKLTKLQSTYIKPLYKFLHEDSDMEDGRIRPNFDPTGTITGRLASTRPNILNIPSRQKTEAAKAIKRLFICDPGNVMVVADYSQAEFRWLAEITEDPDLIRAFTLTYQARENFIKEPTKENAYKLEFEGDFHRHTASMMYGVPITEVKKEQRQAAKAIVFGLVYGMTDAGLAERLGVNINEAKRFIRKFFDRFRKAEEWLRYIEREGLTKGFVLSPLGRRKLIYSGFIYGKNTDRLPPNLVSFINHEKRVCRNAPIQGIASDTNLLACNKIIEYSEAKNKDWKLINTVYDSILIEVPFKDAKECVKVARYIMESPKLFAPFGRKVKVPFAADFSIGLCWGDQYDIVDHKETWTVTCKTCGTKRSESAYPKNVRCEDCGSKDVEIRIVEGKLDKLLKQIKKDMIGSKAG